jgi:hypothetical protein
MVRDRTKTPPAHELLQRFHGAKYISSIDLNSAFLQIPLEESSRIWTAFHFEGQTFPSNVSPFGFRNSLASFIRALQLVLGSDSTGYVLNYVDDIIVYSKTYEEHIKHLDAVLGKLTTAGFTINIDKCDFCKQEIKFLGHIRINSSHRTLAKQHRCKRHHQLNYYLKQKGTICFKNVLPKLPKGEMKHEEVQEKIVKAYERMKL